jgi:hypothetical protein
MVDYPKYNILKYYYSDKTSSTEYEHITGRILVGELVLTEYNNFYFNQNNGDVCNINAEHLRDTDWLVFNTWANQKQMELILKYQPYDFDDTWTKGYSMYSKSLWCEVLKDIRTTKLDLIEGNVKYIEKERNFRYG